MKLDFGSMELKMGQFYSERVYSLVRMSPSVNLMELEVIDSLQTSISTIQSINYR